MARIDPRAIVALLALAGYAAVARAVDNLYPLSTFSMYAADQVTTGSRLLARDERGGAREIEDYTRWHCEEAPTEALERARCEARSYGIPYIDRAIRAQIEERRAPQKTVRSRKVTLIRRTFRFAGPGEPRVEDCAITQCSAELVR